MRSPRYRQTAPTVAVISSSRTSCKYPRTASRTKSSSRDNSAFSDPIAALTSLLAMVCSFLPKRSHQSLGMPWPLSIRELFAEHFVQNLESFSPQGGKGQSGTPNRFYFSSPLMGEAGWGWTAGRWYIRSGPKRFAGDLLMDFTQIRRREPKRFARDFL